MESPLNLKFLPEILANYGENKDCLNTATKLENLNQQLVIQNQTIMQVSKIIALCKTREKKVQKSKEYIEAEKLLLFLTHRKKALVEEIKNIMENQSEEENSNYSGYIRVWNLRFSINNLKAPAVSKKRNQFEKSYVCIFTCGLDVICSEIQRKDDSSKLQFQKEFEFFNLKSNFEIKMYLYFLETKKSCAKSSHQNMFRKKQFRPNFRKMLKWNHIPHWYDLSSIYQISSSSFICCGSFTLNSTTLTKKHLSPFKLDNFSIANALDISVNMAINSMVDIYEEQSGFVTIGYEVGGSLSWDRMWCYLEGSIIKQKNYPCDDSMLPFTHNIDLALCVNSRICEACRELCSKSKTLLIEITPNEKLSTEETIFVKYFLSFDTLADMKNWKIKLNSVLSHLRNWNSMKYTF
ncbi:anillin-like [Agrilus planipennis]|uniref:Anillin-like n=1 Tax=Agrilus planipennis TaxID=224129 RepID=A0A7F5R3V9_AGRPL|nr:anillin-like isoform X3 [Agrilus planipennis]XP_025830398.1 anillin-like [Agrilus planipennis]